MVELIDKAWFYVGIVATIAIYGTRIILNVAPIFQAVKKQENIIKEIADIKHQLQQFRLSENTLKNKVASNRQATERIEEELNTLWAKYNILEERIYGQK